MLSEIMDSAKNAAFELCVKAGLKDGQTVVVGCSTSEILGHDIGTASSIDISSAVFSALYDVFSERGISLAVQCCEHLNRAIVVERNAVSGLGCCIIVNAVPKPDAGGAFAAEAYARLNDPVCLAEFRADAGLDIGGTLIGMHLKHVAVPVRLANALIGKAHVIAARTRPPYIGGARASYDESLS